jgi:hypothetical protein
MQMNDHEKLLLINKVELENKISNLVERQLNNDDEAGRLLDEISASIRYEVRITDRCNLELIEPLLTGKKHFSSLAEYKNARDTDYDYAVDAENDGVEWEGDYTEQGAFRWHNSPCVRVVCFGLAEDASEEAKMFWLSIRNQDKEMKELNCKRQELDNLKKKLLMLEVEIANTEATSQSQNLV